MANKKKNLKANMPMLMKPDPKEQARWRAEDMVRHKMMDSPVIKKEIKRVMQEMMNLEKTIAKPIVTKIPKK